KNKIYRALGHFDIKSRRIFSLSLSFPDCLLHSSCLQMDVAVKRVKQKQQGHWSP
uniref:Uncharacterized protein n=1 Tax=Anopheles minimus TaxID=112268 RepID=A0A182WNF9_9DIPT